MSSIDRFARGPARETQQDGPAIAFGFRGEDINYRDHGRALSVGFTWLNGARLYPDSISTWADGTTLTDGEKATVFHDVLQFIAQGRERLIVVINMDDPSRALWEEMSSANGAWVSAIERTSDDEEQARERAMFLSGLRAGKGLSIDGVDIRDERDLDTVLKARRRRRVP